MSLQIGQQLGSYQITSLIGKGGMGEVYRAKDTKLKRDVAIKILPDEFSRDTDRVSRFQREAESLAALNHQNIAAIYDLPQSDQTRFLILEFVKSDTLADILQRRGALPVEEALQIGSKSARRWRRLMRKESSSLVKPLFVSQTCILRFRYCEGVSPKRLLKR